MTSNIINKGIDTICLVVKTTILMKDVEDMRKQKKVLNSINEITPTKDGKYKKIIFQPSNYLDRTQILDDKSLFYQCVEECLELINGEVIELDRVDIAMDSSKSLDGYKKFARLVILSLAHQHNITRAFTVKNLFDLNEKTVKLKSSRYEVTFYCREDKKHHQAESRMEIRYLRVEKENWKDCIEKKIEKTILDFKGIATSLDELEKVLSEVMRRKYLKELSIGKVSNLTDFTVKYSDFIYTKKIFDEIYQEAGYIGNSNKWLSNFKSTRRNGISFISKSNLDKLSKEVNKNLKSYLQNK